ncbi:helix-turn-helix domain-containing protein [Streptomyces sp. NEAU-S7GS2]|uniref:ArsR/SmtB family transcription factor n=1 Tax=Streptomyces sp. NEAU-S7GS2 TaxID=2202000 RepID=UPI000D6F4E10|nr:helix-turn-helix domain-containing protein [Streptomyces sp. NEAU-S7GS2]AWN25102.1 ArsR family transcriptional regulator [Streptomyces sp. NEAU-S7GS2]
MSDGNRRVEAAEALQDRARRLLPDHPVRIALLDLIAETGTLTSTEAAARLGHSSGLCSFHLRQLARYGLIEEAPHHGGRARPWRLRWDTPQHTGEEEPEEFTALARGLEDESYQHWLAHRDQAPAEWQQDESFSTVLHLTPAETAELATSIRRLFAGYRNRGDHPATRSPNAVAVAAVTRLFPLLTEHQVPPQSTPSHVEGSTDS